MDVSVVKAARELCEMIEESETIPADLPLVVIIAGDSTRARAVAEQACEQSGRELLSRTGDELQEILLSRNTTNRLSDKEIVLLIHEFDSFPAARERSIRSLWQRGGRGVLTLNSWVVIACHPDNVRPSDPDLMDQVSWWCYLDE